MKIERKKESRRILAFLFIGTLLLGCLPLQSVFAQQDTTSSYGLSNPRIDDEGVTTWDCVYFGNYWQNDTNGDGTADKEDEKEPIKWRVLSVDGDDAFLLADKGLDGKPYDYSLNTFVTWERCTIRSWLNGYAKEENNCKKDYTADNFMGDAFSDLEKSAIKITNVVNEDNPIHGTEAGNDTLDKVYLLSLEEVTNTLYGFDSDYSKEEDGRRIENTEYAKAQGAEPSIGSVYEGYGYWWLRTPGKSVSFIDVLGNGRLNDVGLPPSIEQCALRPALHINLSETSCWTNAGKVTSKGEEIPPVTPEPKPTESPAVTEEPVKTPEPTQTPEKTEEPTESPSATEEPEKTPEPVQTPEPAATQTPGTEPTTTPAATEKPVNTPERTAEPAPTRQPSPSPTGTPAPTKSPAPDKNLSDIMDGLDVSEETAVKIQQTAEELNVAKDTLLVTEQTILNQKTDEDIKGAYFARIQAKASQITQNNVKLSWNKVKGADGYEIYGNRCNTKKWIYEYKRMKTITNPNKKSFIDRKCKKGTYYKYIVRAYKIIDGKKVTIAASKTIHVTTTGGKNGNAKSVRVNKKKLSLKQGKTYQIRSKEIKDVKPLRHHREVSYESDVPNIATVSKKGVVKAKKKGNCIIYAYAQNGKYRKIKVKVK